MKPRLFKSLALTLLFMLAADSLQAAEPFSPTTCTFNGIKLQGKVQIVQSFPDIKAKIVSSFPDLKVKKVTSFPDACGKWQFVTSFPDFKIQLVDSFPDVKIRYVDSFPGAS